jgi:predicted metal-dependent HD superfamily phosphohydrolase
MKIEFNQIMVKLDIPEKKSVELFERIMQCYSESHRDYHNLRHIREMLECLHLYRAAIADYPCLYISCLYHDIVYDTHANDNEEKSALYLERDLEEYLPLEKIQKCRDLILGTKKHQFIRNDFDHKIFLDSDLLILGRERNRYLEYMNSIRREYEWVERELYKQERVKVLQKFLDRERIYFTDEIFENNEKQARENINFEIEMYFQE